MAVRSEVISNYIVAKDCNRPWLMRRSFRQGAHLEMVVKTDAISFPSDATGIVAITDTLVKQFSRENENVYTFCLTTAPEGYDREFSCDWLVGMSRRDNGDVRVGCGRYNWRFDDRPQILASNLKITIEVMAVLAQEHLDPIMDWLSELNYPWCPVDIATRGMPVFDELRPVSHFLSQRVERR